MVISAFHNFIDWQSWYQVVGGLAPFSWSSSNSSLASLTQTGAASLQTGRVGQARVTAAMTRSAHNRATADVFVLPPESLRFRVADPHSFHPDPDPAF
jgi:hypothetical protein